jgi:hypothetical protein
MAGGDCAVRHDGVRNIIYRYARRGPLNAELEKSGVLEDQGVILDLRRPADVMVELPGRGVQSHRVALDIKVINALGPDHVQRTQSGPLAAADAYREKAIQHLQTGERCAAKGIRYEPLVFTAQGGCAGHAESLLMQIASAVARAEDGDVATIKAQMLEEISMSIARSVARAVRRRAQTAPSAPEDWCGRWADEGLADGVDDD